MSQDRHQGPPNPLTPADIEKIIDRALESTRHLSTPDELNDTRWFLRSILRTHPYYSNWLALEAQKRAAAKAEKDARAAEERQADAKAGDDTEREAPDRSGEVVRKEWSALEVAARQALSRRHSR